MSQLPLYSRPASKVQLPWPHLGPAHMDLTSSSGGTIQSYKSWLECRSHISLTEGSLNKLHGTVLWTELFSARQLLVAIM